MDILSVSPGLIFWTLVNFLIFLFLIVKFGAKPISNALKSREDNIQKNIDDAEKANADAKALLEQSEVKMNNARQEMSEIVSKGRAQAEELVRKATEDADKVKRQKVEEASNEIDRSKEMALKELRSEVADLVISATEKILDETLDKEKHQKIVETYIEKLPKN